ncbi:hypothetical protein EW026_g2660 [Hermanssonia centrifuga]|uniref:RRM domain-containing protein n=1 Tax=Hermanssonia centrifuga TaxID=98765 RepID=A0A4S4KMJ4_9APHY|nr:hypothetical protein EW026_g2660 [Hermanssonia centrifuga]
MPPKKAQKMSLNEFLGDNTLGSWADEMDALPTAQQTKIGLAREIVDMTISYLRGVSPAGQYLELPDPEPSQVDRGPPTHREDLPLPTEPPFTAFVGNLAFDLTDVDLEEFFAGHQTKSIKIIKDREDKPKGFGYIEFAELDGLKDALSKSGAALAGRNIRISVAEPPKERAGFGSGGGGFDDEKFANNWRRDGPLPDPPSQDGSRRRYDGPSAREPPPPAVSDNISDWRSSRQPARAPPPEADAPSFKRRGSGFRSQEGAPQNLADTEDTWTIGSRFKPSTPSESGGPGSRFGSLRGKGEMGPPRDTASPPDESDWRRPPSSSVPPTPQMGRRKLELLPRSGASAAPSPLSSPNPANTSQQRASPFGNAKPVDTVAKENAVAERLEKEREQVKERVTHPMSRTSSRTASQRGDAVSRSTPTSTAPTSPKAESPKVAGTPSANVRPSFSFASAAAGKKDATEGDDAEVQDVVEKIAEVEI